MSTEPQPPSGQGSLWRVLWLALYYTAILAAIVVLHGQGSFATPKFIYQGF